MGKNKKYGEWKVKKKKNNTKLSKSSWMNWKGLGLFFFFCSPSPFSGRNVFHSHTRSHFSTGLIFRACQPGCEFLCFFLPATFPHAHSQRWPHFWARKGPVLGSGGLTFEHISLMSEKSFSWRHPAAILFIIIWSFHDLNEHVIKELFRFDSQPMYLYCISRLFHKVVKWVCLL